MYIFGDFKINQLGIKVFKHVCEYFELTCSKDCFLKQCSKTTPAISLIDRILSNGIDKITDSMSANY